VRGTRVAVHLAAFVILRGRHGSYDNHRGQYEIIHHAIYTVSHKNGVNLVLSVTSSNVNNFNAVFTVRFRKEQHM